MSISLLRKSLELSSAESTDRSIAKHHKAGKTSRGVADVKKRNVKFVEQVRKKLVKEKKNQEDNYKKLNLLRRPVVQDSLARKILEYSVRQGSLKESESAENKKEEGTAFTEEDFINFEKECDSYE